MQAINESPGLQSTAPVVREPAEVMRAILELHRSLEEAAHAWMRGHQRQARRLCESARPMLADLESFGMAWLERGPFVALPNEERRARARRISGTAVRRFRASVIHAVETSGHCRRTRPNSPVEAWHLFEHFLDQATEDFDLQASVPKTVRARCG